MTRAKTAALTDYDLVKKKPLQSSKSANGVHNTTTQRGRAALGDVTNATKRAEVGLVDGKKAVNGKAGLASKAAPAGVQKLSRTNSSRSAAGLKDHNAKPKPATSELKRRASGAGRGANAQKKRGQSSTANTQVGKDATVSAAEEPPRKRSCAGSEVEVTEVAEVNAEAQVVEHVETTVEAVSEAVVGLDEDDPHDPMLVSEYVTDIFNYYRRLEETTLPNPDYMSRQPDIDWATRGVLVDWLIEVHTRFRLLPETLFLAVNLVDRFLSRRVILLDQFQMFGATAMFIAAKYEEVLSPHIASFVYLADDKFSVEELLEAERYMLATLNYDLSYPNPMNFLRRISKGDGYDVQSRTLAKYLLEISLLDHRFMRYRQSHIAAAAMFLARSFLGSGDWVCDDSS